MKNITFKNRENEWQVNCQHTFVRFEDMKRGTNLSAEGSLG